MLPSLKSLKALTEYLARDPLTVGDVAGRLGKTGKDYGASVDVTPGDPLYRSASIVRRVDQATGDPSGEPAHVTLTPADPPTVEELAREFGAYERVPAEGKIPERAIFYLDAPGRPYRVALIAQLQQGRAVRLILRRDRR